MGPAPHLVASPHRPLRALHSGRSEDGPGGQLSRPRRSTAVMRFDSHRPRSATPRVPEPRRRWRGIAGAPDGVRPRRRVSTRTVPYADLLPVPRCQGIPRFVEHRAQELNCFWIVRGTISHGGCAPKVSPALSGHRAYIRNADALESDNASVSTRRGRDNAQPGRARRRHST